MTMTVIAARVAMRFAAEAKERSATSAKESRQAASLENAWTDCAESKASDALPEEAAIQSWFSRLSDRSRLPKTMIGTITAETISKARPASFGEVNSISASPPARISTLRRATEMEEPTTPRITVVSVVIRLNTSPVMIFS